MKVIGVIGFRKELNKWIKINMQAIPVNYRSGLPERAQGRGKLYYFIEPSRYNVTSLQCLRFDAIIKLTEWPDAMPPDPYFMEFLNTRLFPEVIQNASTPDSN